MMAPDNELERLEKKYKIRTEKKFGRVYLYTQFEEFYFVESNSPNVRLMHYSTRLLNPKDEYHVQFVKQLSLEQVFIYVTQHTKAKYTNKYVRFKV